MIGDSNGFEKVQRRLTKLCSEIKDLPYDELLYLRNSYSNILNNFIQIFINLHTLCSKCQSMRGNIGKSV